MAKAGLNGTMKWIITLAGALITVGVFCQMIRTHEIQITMNREISTTNEKAIIGIQKDIEYIKTGVEVLVKRDQNESQTTH